MEFKNNNKTEMNEAFKILRTNLYSNLKECKIITVTSAMPKDGKSVVAFNLATSLVEDKKKVIFVDADFRKRSENEKGLVDYLINEINIEDIIKNSEIDGLQYINSGTKTNYNTELLSSNKFDKFLENIRNRCDYIIIDTTSFLGKADAPIIIKKTDGFLLVIRAGKNNYKEIDEFMIQLDKNTDRLIGVILNGVNRKDYHYFIDDKDNG